MSSRAPLSLEENAYGLQKEGQQTFNIVMWYKPEPVGPFCTYCHFNQSIRSP